VKYWTIVSKRHKKLYKPINKDDFYDTIYFTKEGAESVCDERYMAVRVEMKIIEDTK